MHFLRIAVLTLALTVVASGREGVLVHLGLVCDTPALAEHYIELINGGVPDAEARSRINTGRPTAACGVLRVHYYPLSPPVTKLMHGEAVHVMQILIIGVDTSPTETIWMIPGVERTVILKLASTSV